MVLVSGKKPIPDPGSRGQKGTKKIVKKLLNIRSWDPGTGSATNLSNQEQLTLSGSKKNRTCGGRGPLGLMRGEE